MKQIRQCWLRIPRPYRAMVNIAAILILAAAAYFSLGSPVLTPIQKFRRVERANLVGPSRILETIHPENGDYPHILVADDGGGVIIYRYGDRFNETGDFLYREKTGGVTVLPVPNHQFSCSEKYELDLPILLFHDCPNAWRAEIVLTFGEGLGIRQTQWENGGEVALGFYEQTYRLEAHSDIEGYFRFNLHLQSQDWYVDENGMDRGTPLGKAGYAVEVFCRMMDMNRFHLEESVPVTVRLYDEDNALLLEQDLTIRSAAGEVYARREGIS